MYGGVTRTAVGGDTQHKNRINVLGFYRQGKIFQTHEFFMCYFV